MYLNVSHGRDYVTFFVTCKLAVTMNKLSLHLHLRKDKKGDTNTYPLFIRLSSKGISVYHSLKLKLKTTEWDANKSEIRASSVHAHFNRDLLIIKSRFVAKLNELPFNVEFTKDDLKLFLGLLINGSPQPEKVIKQGEPTLGELMKEFYDSSLDKKVSTLACYRVLITKLSNFQNSIELPISKIDLPWLLKFESHLASNLNNKTNTISREMKNLKACFNYAIQEERIDPKTYPFKRYKIKTEKVMKESLSTEELRRLELYNPLSKLEQLSKDLFIFSAYGGGLRHSDCFTLKMKHIHDKRYILKEQVKTKGAVAIPIHSKAAEIISRYYKENEAELFLFSVLPENFEKLDAIQQNDLLKGRLSYINKTLKQMALKVKLEKNVSFHMARRTFASRANEVGADMPSISRMMGHKSIKQTESYITLNQAHLDSIVDKL